VELKLVVKPHIGEGDTVRLEVNQQAEELAGENTLGPITSTRAQKTTIVARDDETVVLGGIMQDRLIESVSKTPVLGDIPLLGNLFRFTSKKKVKVNLLVYLTPHLVRDPSDVRRILERKEQERAKALEQLYGRVPGFEVSVDFTRKRGPVMAIGRALTTEAARPENGGQGNPGETVVTPVPLEVSTRLPHGVGAPLD
jgi:general secretion pathway protein D